MSVSVIVPFRNSATERLDNLKTILRHLQECNSDWQILVIEQDEESRIPDKILSDRIRHEFIFNPRAFNKAWAVNVGYRKCNSDIMVVCDSDMIVSCVDLHRAIQAVELKLDMVRPYSHMIDLTREQTNDYYENQTLPLQPDRNLGFDRNYTGESLCLAGGVFVVRRQFFASSGGMDERFEGWGGEDDAFSIKVCKLSDSTALAKEALAWHLWHPRSDRSAESNYARNIELLKRYEHARHEDIASMGTGGASGDPLDELSEIGDPEKYSRKIRG